MIKLTSFDWLFAVNPKIKGKGMKKAVKEAVGGILFFVLLIVFVYLIFLL